VIGNVSISRRQGVEWNSLPLGPGQVAIGWLGQAGFAFRYGRRAFLIDPYLSDSLAAKYEGKEFPHPRMMPAPVAPGDLSGIGWVFCSHRHGDHMDPGTLPVIADNIPECRFIVPAACVGHAVESVGLPREAVSGVNAGQHVELAHGFHVEVLASAHEELAFNDRGESEFLGFIFQLGDVRIYHSGDCTPYRGLEQSLSADPVDIAIMPVNGRDEYRTSRGIIGNFHLEEALRICEDCRIPVLLPCHFGMFAFNTADVAALKMRAQTLAGSVRIVVPEINETFLVCGEPQ